MLSQKTAAARKGPPVGFPAILARFVALLGLCRTRCFLFDFRGVPNLWFLVWQNVEPDAFVCKRFSFYNQATTKRAKYRPQDFDSSPVVLSIFQAGDDRLMSPCQVRKLLLS